jgi:hypothetical protein
MSYLAVYFEDSAKTESFNDVVPVENGFQPIFAEDMVFLNFISKFA